MGTDEIDCDGMLDPAIRGRHGPGSAPIFAAATGRGTVCGAVLIGGKSVRMGFPKHLAVVGGETVLERVMRILDDAVDEILIVGAGRLPRGLREPHRVVDAADCGVGPMAGILTAMRWRPHACWVVVACDMVNLELDAVRWVLGQRAPDHCAVLPRNSAGHVEPLLAVYEPQARLLLEDLLATGRLAPRALAESERVRTPPIPPGLRSRWIDVNRPEDLERSCSGAS